MRPLWRPRLRGLFAGARGRRGSCCGCGRRPRRRRGTAAVAVRRRGAATAYRSLRRRRAAAGHARRAHAQQSAKAPARSPSACISRTMRPRSITTTRSATSSTRSRFCSTISSESRCARAAPRALRRSPARSTAGCPRSARRAAAATDAGTSARASARICCSPPDSAPPRRSSSGRSRGNSVDDALDRLRLGLAGVGASRPGAGSRARSGPAGCRGPAARSRCPCGCARAPVHAVDVDAVETDAPAGRRQQADQRLQQRGLAHAVVADDADRLALVHLQRRCRAAPARGRSRRAGSAMSSTRSRPAGGIVAAIVGRGRAYRSSSAHLIRAAPDVDLAHPRVGQHLVGRAFASGSRPGAAP